MSELLKFLAKLFSYPPKEESDSLRKEITKLEIKGVETAGRLGALEKAVGVLEAKSEKKAFSWTQFLISTLIAIIGVGVSAWVAYIQNREHHDLVAKVLKIGFLPAGLRGQNGELYVDIGVVNRGNQAEIIRRLFLQISGTGEYSGFSQFIDARFVNQRIEKGDKQVVRASITNFMDFGGQQRLLSVGIVGIAPDASDVKCVWPITGFQIATNAQGGSLYEHTNAHDQIQVISRKRLSHQKANDLWY